MTLFRNNAALLFCGLLALTWLSCGSDRQSAQKRVVDGIDWSAREGGDLIGEPLPQWEVNNWVTDRLPFGRVGKRVIVVQFWSEDDVSRNTGYGLRSLDREFGEAIDIISFYHPLPQPVTMPPSNIARLARRYRYKWSIVLDDRWFDLQKYWLRDRERSSTFVTMVVGLDRTIRYVRVGEYRNDPSMPELQSSYDEIRAVIAELLAERDTT